MPKDWIEQMNAMAAQAQAEHERTLEEQDREVLEHMIMFIAAKNLGREFVAYYDSVVKAESTARKEIP